MSQLPCAYCDVPIPLSEAERTNLCPVCARPLTVCGRYRLKELLSKSDADRVYSAVRDGDGQEVAVKVLLAREDDWSALSEFERVSRALQSMKNPALPQIYAWERGGHGRLILVREKFHGHTLETRLQSGQRPQLADVRVMLTDLLPLLGDLHAMSPPLLHRDIRPGNILFRKAGSWSPVLADFQPSGAGTVALDLFALGKAMESAGGAALPVVARLIDPKHPFASAREALHFFDVGVATGAPPPRAMVAPGPTAPSKPRSLVLVVMMLIFAGLFGRFLMFQGGRKGSKPTKPSPTAAATAPSEFGDSTVKRYRSECDRGDAMGCYNLGYRYESGKGIAKSEIRAAALYQKSCDSGEKMACNNLAVLYETGRGVIKDASLAAGLYQRACDSSDWLACRNLGYLYSNGTGVMHDIPRAVSLYRRACDHGEIKGCFNLGVLYENGKGVSVDFPRAIKLYQQACDGEDWEGCTNAGWLYASGSGVPKDDVKARRLYEQGCDHGDARGCNNAGVIYEHGREVPVDLARALALYQQGCDGGDSYGCANLGYFYESGKGTEKNLDESTKLYQKACKLGYEKGCSYFIDMCKDARTRRIGLMLLQQACEGGDAWSCDQLKKLG